MKYQVFTRLGLAAGIFCLAASAQNATIPDAQVESNVLRQLATAPDLSTQNIQTTTVYGVVTLSGNVHDESMRNKAEDLASRAMGVKKVVDQMTLGDTPPQSDQGQAPDNNDPSMNGNMAPQDPGQPSADGNMQPPSGPGQAGPPPAYNGENDQQGPPQRQPMYGNQNGYAQSPPPRSGPYSAQRPGVPVTIPPGAPLQIRLNRGFNSDEVAVGTPFTGVVMYDVVGGGQIAIPRGASVSGTVTDAKHAGAFKGQGQLSLQINSVTLGGQVYPLTSAVWDARGRDKTGRTVGNAVGLGILGALVGGAVGGGGGAAIGAVAGAGAGVAVTGAQPGGRIMLPPETMLGFVTAEPTTITTVSQQEMARLSYAAGPPPAPRPNYRHRYYSPYYGWYYGPGM